MIHIHDDFSNLVRPETLCDIEDLGLVLLPRFVLVSFTLLQAKTLDQHCSGVSACKQQLGGILLIRICKGDFRHNRAPSNCQLGIQGDAS